MLVGVFCAFYFRVISTRTEETDGHTDRQDPYCGLLTRMYNYDEEKLTTEYVNNVFKSFWSHKVHRVTPITESTLLSYSLGLYDIYSCFCLTLNFSFAN